MTLKIPIWDAVVEHDTVDNIGEVVALYNPTGDVAVEYVAVYLYWGRVSRV